jgi:excisionase family DNA binding protein
MTSHLHTVEQVAELLHLHVKTVRRYIRDGRLKARRIGKEYRIARTDLDEFAGGSLAAPARPVATRRQVLASTFVDVDAISPEDSQRITTMIMASLNSRRGLGDFPNVNSMYYPELGKLRITITASPVLTASMLQLINGLSNDGRADYS